MASIANAYRYPGRRRAKCPGLAGRRPRSGHRRPRGVDRARRTLRCRIAGAAAEHPMDNYTVGYFVGSLSSTSINRKLANALGRLAPPGITFTEIGFADLPLYRPEFDADYPPPAKAFKAAIAEVDALLFVTPEYNRSIPGAL